MTRRRGILYLSLIVVVILYFVGDALYNQYRIKEMTKLRVHEFLMYYAEGRTAPGSKYEAYTEYFATYDPGNPEHEIQVEQSGDGNWKWHSAAIRLERSKGDAILVRFEVEWKDSSTGNGGVSNVHVVKDP